MKCIIPLTVALAAGLCISCSRQPDRPNVVLITLDTVRQDRIGCYGYDKATTPAIDGLARDGILFENADCQAPITLPSHASILTGLFPPRHGLRLNGNFVLPEGVAPLPAIVRDQGYMTAAFVSSFVLDSQFGLDRGFDVYDDAFFGGPRPTNPERPAEETGRAATRWLAEDARPPFLLWTHFFDAHAPFVPPEPFASAHTDAPYDGEIAYADHWVGEILSTLSDRGWTESTLVVVVADHGEGLGDHGEETHSFFLYDTTIKVPLVMRLPKTRSGNVPDEWAPGARIRAIAESVDLVPTILSLIGMETHEDFDGVNLADADAVSERVAYAETIYPLSFGWSPLHSARQGDWKYIKAPRPELYDTGEDPGELRDLIENSSPAADDLSAWLHGLLTTVEPVGRNTAAVDPNMLQTLRSLGYLGSSTASSGYRDTSERADPKDRIGVFDKINLARAYNGDGRFQEALDLLAPHFEEEAENPVLLQVAGRSFEGLGDLRKAIALYTQCRDLDPQNLEL